MQACDSRAAREQPMRACATRAADIQAADTPATGPPPLAMTGCTVTAGSFDRVDRRTREGDMLETTKGRPTVEGPMWRPGPFPEARAEPPLTPHQTASTR